MMKLNRVIQVFALVLLFAGCSGPQRQPAEPERYRTGLNIRTKPGSSFSDSLQLENPCAVFYSPDSLQRQKIKQLTAPGVFDGTMHEFFYQQKSAHSFLHQHLSGLKIIDPVNVRFLVFARKGTSSCVVDLDQMGDSYGLIVYDGVQAPRLIDMTNIETQVAEYFNRH